jgi:nitrite reductase/ring-hydroxylating ferredoxin subunit
LPEVRVGKTSDFEDRGRKVVAHGDVEVGVFYVDGEFYAWHNKCPHQGGPVCQGRLYGLVEEPVAADGTVGALRYAEGQLNIVCPWHGYEYNVKTGRHPGHDRIGLRPAEVQVREGEVYVIV